MKRWCTHWWYKLFKVDNDVVEQQLHAYMFNGVQEMECCEVG